MDSLKIKLSKGLDIPVAGVPEQVVQPANPVQRVALLGSDYVGLRPKLLVDVGQAVALGDPVFFDKHDPQTPFVSPGTGRVVAINRAKRRRLQSVVIELDADAAQEATFDLPQTPDPAAVRDILLRSGLWTSLRTRPYNRVANSSATPRSIFVTAIDTRPLAADPQVVIARRASQFEKGMAVIRLLGDWPVYLCTGSNWTGPRFDDGRIRHVEFSGPHPAGLVGTHIHHLDPVASDRVVWHIGYQDVIEIGHLFETGRLLTERIIAIGGPGALRPRLLSTRQGADMSALMDGEIKADQNCRVISGSLLDGLAADAELAFLGRYHNQVSIIPDIAPRRMPGWFSAGTRSNGFASLFASIRHKPEFTTAADGRCPAMLPVEALDRVMPLDILSAPLLRAMLVKDTDAAQELGCLELCEEDLALSSFVCPAKQNYGAALRINLNQIEREG